MGKFFHSVLVIIIAGILCSCRKQNLPVPVYPLDASTIEEALHKTNLLWTIAKEESWVENHTVYTMHDTDGRMTAVISSAEKNEKRLLIMVFMPSQYDLYHVTISVPDEDWEKVIKFGTILYGGFENENSVYNNFVNNYDSKSSTVEVPEIPPGAMNNYIELMDWSDKFNDIYYIIRTGHVEKDSPHTDLSFIKFYNSEEFIN